MLGDTGSNLIGALAGLWLVLTLATTGPGDRRSRVLLAITVYGEFRSISALDRADSAASAARLAREDLHDLTARRPHRPASSSSPAASSPRSARGSPPPRSAGCSSRAASRSQLQKFDPYINVDPGTMSPYQHGEVFVTEDGAETDLDLGHYERFTDANTRARLERHRRRRSTTP